MIRLPILLCVLLLFPQLLKAQSPVDSLLRVVANSDYDTAKVEAYNELIWEYYGANNDSALYFGKLSIDLAERIGYKKGLSNAHRYTGNVYEQMSDYAKALYHQQQGLNIAESILFKPAIASSLSNIGSIYERLNDQKKALDYLERSLKMCIEIDQKEGIAAVNGNIGNIYFNIKAFNKALEFYQRSLEMNQELENPYGIAVSLSNIGNVHIEKGDFKKGLEYHTQSLEIRTRINHRQGMASSMASLGVCYQNLGDVSTAKKYFSDAIQLSNEIQDMLSGVKAYKGMYKIHRELKEFEKALFYHEEFTRLNDSVFSTQRNEEISNMRTKFALEQQQKELDRKAEEEMIRIQAKADGEKQQQRIIIYASVAVLILVVLFSLFLFNRFRVISRQKGIIETQKAVVEETNKQITDSINYAKRIQTALLPTEEDIKTIFPESFVLFMPKDIVSGDFYWASSPDSDTTIIAIADCTGHGVPGGFMSMLGTSYLNEIVNEKSVYEPAKILDLLRDRIIFALKQQGHAEESKDGMDISICKFEKRNNRVVYAGANNNVYVVRNNTLSEYPANKMPIGYHAGKMIAFSQQEIPLEKGDMVYAFTDGYADQFGGPDGKKFKYAQLEKLLCSISSSTSSDQKKKLENAFQEWKLEIEQVDDICLLGIRYI